MAAGWFTSSSTTGVGRLLAIAGVGFGAAWCPRRSVAAGWFTSSSTTGVGRPDLCDCAGSPIRFSGGISLHLIFPAPRGRAGRGGADLCDCAGSPIRFSGGISLHLIFPAPRGRAGRGGTRLLNAGRWRPWRSSRPPRRYLSSATWPHPRSGRHAAFERRTLATVAKLTTTTKIPFKRYVAAPSVWVMKVAADHTSGGGCNAAANASSAVPGRARPAPRQGDEGGRRPHLRRRLQRRGERQQRGPRASEASTTAGAQEPGASGRRCASAAARPGTTSPEGFSCRRRLRWRPRAWREWSALCIGRSKTRNHIARRLFVPPPAMSTALVEVTRVNAIVGMLGPGPTALGPTPRTPCVDEHCPG